MEIHNVNNLQELHIILSNFHIEKGARKWVFRGQIDRPDWKLNPKAGREKLRIPDENLFRAWKRHAYALEHRIFENDWEWLYIAQHHGLVTRLLDWTTNPLAAVFFAIRHIQPEFGAPIEKPRTIMWLFGHTEMIEDGEQEKRNRHRKNPSHYL